MQLAIIIAFLVWLGVLARLFVEIGRDVTLPGEFFSIGATIAWGAAGFAGAAHTIHIWSFL